MFSMFISSRGIFRESSFVGVAQLCLSSLNTQGRCSEGAQTVYNYIFSKSLSQLFLKHFTKSQLVALSTDTIHFDVS